MQQSLLPSHPISLKCVSPILVDCQPFLMRAEYSVPTPRHDPYHQGGGRMGMMEGDWKVEMKEEARREEEEE